MATTKPRTRLTADSVATIPRAETARVTETDAGSYKVTVFKGSAQFVLQDGGGDATYETITAAKQAVRRHNPNIRFPKQSGTPAPGFE